MTVAFDFDGVIHKYSKGWQDGSIYDEISIDWVKVVNHLLDEKHNVFILTTRPKRQIYKHFYNMFHSYCAMTGGKTDDEFSSGFAFRVMPFWERFFNNKKDHKDFKGKTIGICNHKAVFDVLIDDRVICFEGSFVNMLNKIERFKPWGEK